MNVTSPVHQALDRVTAERKRTDGELTALDQFEDGVQALDPVSRAESTGTVHIANNSASPATTAYQQTAATTTRTQRVCDLFAETIHPHSVDGSEESESIETAMCDVLGRDIATVLSPSTPGTFTDEVKQAICVAIAQRRSECRVTLQALDLEAESLRTAQGEIEEITDWLASGESLISDGFERLQDRHETLAAYRSQIERLSSTRQTVLHGTTNRGSEVGLRQLSLVDHLYTDLETTYPVLSTIVRLEAACREAQRAVRDHLTRRV